MGNDQKDWIFDLYFGGLVLDVEKSGDSTPGTKKHRREETDYFHRGNRNKTKGNKTKNWGGRLVTDVLWIENEENKWQLVKLAFDLPCLAVFSFLVDQTFLNILNSLPFLFYFLPFLLGGSHESVQSSGFTLRSQSLMCLNIYHFIFH